MMMPVYYVVASKQGWIMDILALQIDPAASTVLSLPMMEELRRVL